MKTITIKKIAIVVLGTAFVALANLGPAQTVICTDNFDISGITRLDGSDQTVRHTGLLVTNVLGRSGGTQFTITSSNLKVFHSGGGSDGRMRFAASTNVSGTRDWASGSVITAAGGRRIDFDWSAADNTPGNWINYTVGITPNSDVNIRGANSGTDSGILLGTYDLYVYSCAGNLAQENVSQFTANGQTG